MNTLILGENETDKAADIIRGGGLVAIPTETVYGLAANAFDGLAVSKVFAAKGRPMDNPLIVHISSMSELDNIVSRVSEEAMLLAKHFWPGPFTMILPKLNTIPDEVSAGLDTVAVRFPSNETAQKIIKKSGVPLAAPSANSSGYPSPTIVDHVIKDLYGKIDAIVDGGACSVGLESTVISLSSGIPKLLRPGAVTLEQIKNVIEDVEIDSAVYRRLENGEKAISPGMKYKHYSPLAKVILIKGNKQGYINYVNHINSDGAFALCFDEDINYLKIPYISYGKSGDYGEQATKLFLCLRKLDQLNAEFVYARCPENPEGVGLAVYNRLIRAAGFEVINAE